MIRQVINVHNYWKVIIYFNVDYNLFHHIVKDLRKINISYKLIKRVYYNMSNGFAKGVTISNIEEYTSIVCFNCHKSQYDYINSIAHECEHIKQDMLRGYMINDKGEAPAYTMGYLMMKMIMILGKL